jgi:deoxyribodipyrimidine photo-lyase
MGKGLGRSEVLFGALPSVPQTEFTKWHKRHFNVMTTPDMFPEPKHQSETVAFEPTRRAGLERLEKFITRTGAHYAGQRNYDYGPTNRSSVSALSPWIKHRLITQEDVLTQTLAHHSLSASMKFVQEVFWRSYFKGWMEQHPSVWHGYLSGLEVALEAIESNKFHKTDYDEAIAGHTGIDCFDHWCDELKETGYLHNHARMWFASIWIFTLRLPWELGAEFFLSHLIDGDPAANTLSWRWVGGLHTKGKSYLARPSNIAQFTDGRFDPVGQLSPTAEPLVEDMDHPFVPLSAAQPMPQGEYVLLITSEDCQPETYIRGSQIGVLGMLPTVDPKQSAQVRSFETGAVADAIARSGQKTAAVLSTQDWATTLIEAAHKAGTNQIITPWAAIGTVATQLDAAKTTLEQAGIHLHQQQRTYDTLTWPHATKGFFKLKKKIPSILNDLGFVDI